MNKELSQELLKRADSILDAVGKAASKAGEFASEQLPDIAMQYIAFGRAYETSMLALGMAGIAVSVWGTIKMFKSEWEEVTPMMLIPFLLSATVAGIHIKSTILVWAAPKIYLITSIAELLK